MIVKSGLFLWSRLALTNHWLRFFVWLSLVTLVIGGLWWVTERKIHLAEQEARGLAMRQSVSLANSYAGQLQHVVDQMNHMTLSVANAWQDSPKTVNLEQDQERGIFPSRFGFALFITDQNGRIVKASFRLKEFVTVSKESLFGLHRDDCCLGMLISSVERSQPAGRSVIQFSRRINRVDGSFAGVVVITVAPEFLTSFQNEALPGKHDFVSAHLVGGSVLATRMGGDGRQRGLVYKLDPGFHQMRGSIQEVGEHFDDARARYVAWRTLDDYPLVALAGLTEEDSLVTFRALARSYRLTLVIASSLLILLTLVGWVFSTKLAVRRRAEENVRKTYRMATDAANEGFYMLLPVHDSHNVLVDFQIEDCNERAAALLGMLRGHLVGFRASKSMAPQLHADFLMICQRALAHGVYEDEFRVPAGGWLKATWLYRRAVHSGAGIALTLRDISEVKAHEQALADLANNDSLTKLPNRRWLMNFLPAAIRRAARGRGRLALFFIDLDNFKIVNDTLGHEAGDELLVQAASLIKGAVRSSDHVVRLGGDEFTVVLEQMEDPSDIARVADSILEALSRQLKLTNGAGHRVSASVGISVYPDHGDDADTLIKHADVAMYAAKSAGKGRYFFYEPKLSDALILRMNKELALRNAIENDEFIVHYQPRVDTKTGKLCSLEALVRWQHPERGLVMPAEFISLAEETGLIVQLGESVLRKVGEQISLWRSEGVRVVPVSVNVSPRQLQFGRTAACIADVLQSFNIESRLLEIEITESTMVDNTPIVLQELESIQKLGIRLMIDDFGTGYSSLAQLHRMDVDTLKVDQAFTQALSQGSEGELMYRAIVSMAAALKMCVVAEGVETLEQLRLLQAIGCDEVQGFIISRALPAADIMQLVSKNILPPFDRVGRLVAVGPH